MKRKIILIAVGILFILYWLIMDLMIYRVKGICKDEQIVSLLKNDDETPEFVLNGVYYILPCKYSAFLENGWLPHFKVEQERPFLPAFSTTSAELELEFRNRKKIIITVNLVNDSNKDISVDQASVYGIRTGFQGGLFLKDYRDCFMFVTKKGINLITKPKDAYEALSGFDNFSGYIETQLFWERTYFSSIKIGDTYTLQVRNGETANNFFCSVPYTNYSQYPFMDFYDLPCYQRTK